jgi:hypothetical protein
MANSQDGEGWDGPEDCPGIRAPDGYFRPIIKGNMTTKATRKDGRETLSLNQRTAVPTTPPCVQSPYLHSTPDSVSPYEQLLYAQPSYAGSPMSTRTSYFPIQPLSTPSSPRKSTLTQPPTFHENLAQKQHEQMPTSTSQAQIPLLSITTPIVDHQQSQSGSPQPPLAKHDSARNQESSRRPKFTLPVAGLSQISPDS